MDTGFYGSGFNLNLGSYYTGMPQNNWTPDSNYGVGANYNSYIQSNLDDLFSYVNSPPPQS